MPQWFLWTVLFQKQLRGIDRVNAKRILDAIDGLRFGRGDIENMVGYDPPTRRLRVGGYRVLYRELPDTRFLLLRVATRGDIYKD